MKVYGRENCQSEAERTFFDWLQNELDTSKLKHKLSFAVASVRPDNPHGPDIELDFVLVGEAGVLPIEVKGGIISVNEGEWSQYHEPMSDPFIQASNSYYALQKFLIKKSACKGMVGYFACAFPDMALSEPMSQLYSDALYIDKRFKQAPESYIDTIFEYSYGKFGKKSLTKLEIENIRNILVPNYDRYIRDMANYTDEAVIKLSSEQSIFLESLSGVNRIIIEGPPGSGKTVLAIEMLAQKESQKVKTIYVCYNKALRNKVEHDVAVRVGHKPEFLSIMTLEDTKKLGRDTFDFAILDEAQDFLNNEAFDYIDNILVNGLENGRFRIFMSIDQNIFEQQIDMMYLIELYKSDRVVFCNLKYNYRNSSNIIEAVERLTKLSPGKVHGNPTGLDVEVLQIPYDGVGVDFEEYTKNINRTLNALIDEGFKPEDMMLMTTSNLGRSSLSDSHIRNIKLKNGFKLIKSQDVDWSKDLNSQGVPYGSSWTLKGIDSKIVVCLDYYDPDKQQASALVALTRARSRLIVFVGKHIKA